MGLLEQIERDLKSALLSGDKTAVETLRGIKNALQYEAVGLKVKLTELKDNQIEQVLSRESKKRQEAAELYSQASEAVRAEAELAEKKIIEKYLPDQLSEQEIQVVVDDEISKLDNPEVKDMGKIIAAARGRLQARADGATIARLTKSSLERK